MLEARRNGSLTASSDETVVVEGNYYFPLESIDPALLRPSATTANCPWKGLLTLSQPRSMVPRTAMQLGIIPILNLKRKPSATASPFGKA